MPVHLERGARQQRRLTPPICRQQTCTRSQAEMGCVRAQAGSAAGNTEVPRDHCSGERLYDVTLLLNSSLGFFAPEIICCGLSERRILGPADAGVQQYGRSRGHDSWNHFCSCCFAGFFWAFTNHPISQGLNSRSAPLSLSPSAVLEVETEPSY